MKLHILLVAGAAIAAPRLGAAQEQHYEHHEVHTTRGPHGMTRHEETRTTRTVHNNYRNERTVHNDQRNYHNERVPVRGQEHYRRYVVHNDRDIDVYRRPYVHYRGYRNYGVYYGLPRPLVAYPNLRFLSDGLLVASYVDATSGETVYVYLIDEGGVHREYFVRADGAILSSRIVP